MLLLLDWRVGKGGCGMAAGRCPAFCWDRVNLLLNSWCSAMTGQRLGGLCPRPTGLQGVVPVSCSVADVCSVSRPP